MRLTTAFIGVIVANIVMTFMSATATQPNRGRSNDGLNLEDFDALLRNGTMDPEIVRGLTPTTPVPDNVECYVEIRRGRDRGVIGDLGEEVWNLTPSPPTEEEVECYIQVRRVEHVGGRCIPLGSRGMRVCQAGPNLDPYNDECLGRRPRGGSMARVAAIRRGARRQLNRRRRTRH